MDPNLTTPIESFATRCFRSSGWLLRICFFSWAALSSTPALPQLRIHGAVKADNGKPVSFANILLLNASDSSLEKGVIANAGGEFIIEDVRAGEFFIISTMVGYKKATVPVFEISSQQQLDAVSLILKEEPVRLSEVTVEAEKAMFEQRIDRLVINVQNSITTAGNTVLEVLQKSPGIIVNRQNNSVSMNGKSGVRIMMNGKMMQLPMDALVQMLDGMSAANIDQIELITTPPAKYEAEGNSGIIHIIMNENADHGTSGNISVTLGYKWAEVYGTNFNLQHRSRKAAYFLDYSFMRQRNQHLMDLHRESDNNGFIQKITDFSNRKNVTTVQSLQGGVEIPLTRKSTLGFLFTASGNKWDLTAHTTDVNQAAPDSTVITDMRIQEINNWRSATSGMKYEIRPNAKSDISIDLDFIYYTNNNPSGYDNNIFYFEANSQAKDNIDVTKHTPLSFLVGTLDYVYHLTPTLTIETGLKGVLSKLNNNVIVRRWKDHAWSIDPVFTSNAELQENIGAAYFSATWKNKNGLHLSGGLRYEHTKTYISTPKESGIINRNYGNFFPSFFVKKDIDKEKDISFSYARRITRPTFRDIAPFVFFWSPNTFSSGNTSLRPSISDAFRAGYHAGPWVLFMLYNQTKNEISFLQPEIDKGNLIYRSQNLQYLNTLSLTNSISFSPAPWWELQTNVTGQYQTARTSHLETNASLTFFNVNIHLNNQLKLPNDFSIEVSGFYQSKSVFGISAFMPFGSLNAGIQKKFKNHSTLRFGMDDILSTNNWGLITKVSHANLNSRMKYDWHNQFIRFTYARNFGNKKLRSVKVETGSDEERKRAN